MKVTHKKILSHRKRLSLLLSDGEFQERILRELRSKTLRISSSETMSLYSDSSEGELYLGGLKNLSSREALALVMCYPKDDLLWWWIREKILAEAYRHQYKGPWKFVQKILNINDECFALRFFLEYHTSQELFGNLLPLANKRISRIKVQRAYTKVKIPQRKRGYNDHGSRKDDSKWLPSCVHLGPNPEKPDHQNKVAKTIIESIRNFLWS